ncbi:MAG: 3-deoxy-7-phosphoheptulonate synthase [Anaerolineae bacterium]|nr:MAG: 3-deoxy-7-phosphoheptulonate synthase [Anaerolineae bacterium]
MIIVMKRGATQAQIEYVVARVERLGYKTHLSEGQERSIVGLIGDDRPIDPRNFEPLEGVEKVLPVLKPFKLASREMHPLDTLVNIDGLTIGGNEIVIMAGPCSVEDRGQLLETAHAVRETGATILRGGAFKPRTSPYSFQGLGEPGLKLLAEARLETGLKVITEAMSPEQVPLVADYADIIQLGARNMQNYELLRAAGRSGRPVLLKRGLMATVEEWLMSAEYLLSVGNERVILCERGIRSFESYTRNTTDINAIPVVRELSHLPVILDPSHSTGKWEYVSAVARAGVAAGADGLLVEVHPRPEEALSDGAQSLRPERFADMVRQVREVARAVGRDLLEVEWNSKIPA